jgi:hypothetical protein
VGVEFEVEKLVVVVVVVVIGEYVLKKIVELKMLLSNLQAGMLL